MCLAQGQQRSDIIFSPNHSEYFYVLHINSRPKFYSVQLKPVFSFRVENSGSWLDGFWKKPADQDLVF